MTDRQKICRRIIINIRLLWYWLEVPSFETGFLKAWLRINSRNACMIVSYISDSYLMSFTINRKIIIVKVLLARFL